MGDAANFLSVESLVFRRRACGRWRLVRDIILEMTVTDHDQSYRGWVVDREWPAGMAWRDAHILVSRPLLVPVMISL